MSLIFRMIYVLLASFFKPRLPVKHPTSDLSFRVLPNDIDINLHMNNGRYLTICDLSRVDVFIRSGLAKCMIKEKWMPVITEHTMSYKKPLGVFHKYHVKMEIVSWDEKSFHMNHTFISAKSGRVLAEGTSKGSIVSKQGVLQPELVMKHVEQQGAKLT